jgi:hypothetical protein
MRLADLGADEKIILRRVLNNKVWGIDLRLYSNEWWFSKLEIIKTEVAVEYLE